MAAPVATPNPLSRSEPDPPPTEATPAPPSPITRSLKSNPSFGADKKTPEPVLSRSANSTPTLFKLFSKDSKDKEKKEKKHKEHKEKDKKEKDKKPGSSVPAAKASDTPPASTDSLAAPNVLAMHAARRPSTPAPPSTSGPAAAQQRGKSLPEVPPARSAAVPATPPTNNALAAVQATERKASLAPPVDQPATGSGAETTSHADDITARNYEELPSDMQKLLSKAKISKEKANADWVIVVAILEFQLKKKFACAKELYADEKELARNPQLRIQIPADHPFHLPPEKLYSESSAATKYAMGAQLGAGGFGVVFSATKIGTTEKVAIKKLPHITSTQIRHNGAEVALMRALTPHPNVAHLLDAFLVGQEAWLVMELIEGGAVTETCKRYNFEEPEMAYVAEGMLQAIQFLHKNKVLHRDLKSANLMMTIQAEIKLIDFGLCCALSASELKTGMVGSPFWMSPEMIRHEPYSYQTDIWSFGITMLELANRVPPNAANVMKVREREEEEPQNEDESARTEMYNVLKAEKNIKRAMYTTAKEGCTELFLHPKHWSADCKDFITKALTFDTAKRPLTDAMLKHPFLKKAANQKHMKKVLGSNFLDQTLDVLNM